MKNATTTQIEAPGAKRKLPAPSNDMSPESANKRTKHSLAVPHVLSPQSSNVDVCDKLTAYCWLCCVQFWQCPLLIQALSQAHRLETSRVEPSSAQQK